MNDLGQYLPRSSILHHRDPRIKILALLALSLLILRLNHLGLGLVLLLIGIMAALGKITAGELLKASRPIWLLSLLLFLVYLLFTPGPPLLNLLGDKWYLSREGLSLGILMVGRFWLLVLAAAILTMTTSITEITFGLQKLLAPLKIVGISSYNIATMVSLAVRFVPVLQMELNQVQEAQAARGADWSSARAKLKAIRFTAIPLIMNVIRRSEDLIEAMEARGYRPGPRTYLFEPSFSPGDYLAGLFLLILLVAVLLGRGEILI